MYNENKKPLERVVFCFLQKSVYHKNGGGGRDKILTYLVMASIVINMFLTKKSTTSLFFIVLAFLFVSAPLITNAASNTFRKDAKPYIDALRSYVNDDVGSVVSANTKIFNNVIKALKKARYDVTNLKSNVAEMKKIHKDMKSELKDLKRNVNQTAKTATDFDEILALISNSADELDVLANDLNDVINEIIAEIESL